MLSLSHNQFCEWLREHQACPEGYCEVLRQRYTARDAWERTDNPSWLIWVTWQRGASAHLLVRVAMSCAEACASGEAAVDVEHLTQTIAATAGDAATPSFVAAIMLVAVMASLTLSRANVCDIIRATCADGGLDE